MARTRISNCIFAFLNILILILSLAIFGAALVMRVHDGSHNCQKVVEVPLLITGACLLVVSLLGLIGSCCRVTILLWIYSFLTYVLLLATLVFAVFAFAVTNKDAGKALSGIGKIADYNNWLRDHFVEGSHWNGVKSCLIDAQVCKKLDNNLFLIQSACCKPPEFCGFVHENATTWTIPETGPAAQDADCTAWSNDQRKLCYDCNSCKAGFLDNIRKEWRAVAIINACVLCFIVLIYSTSCCTRKSIEPRSKYYH